jgi:para-nitrobenzyl esterase
MAHSIGEVVSQVRTENGVIEGLEVDGLHFYRNIPFAAAPFGANRFRPPQPVANWDGVRDATKPGPAAPQPRDESPLAPLYDPPETGEDCLTLEVWTPSPGKTGLPVMVHIHGGGYMSGAGSVHGYTGKNFARDGVVHVGINYRLGIDGFLYFGGEAENLGLQDQTAALRWVQRNIAAFGGDPSKVTIFGQSGGAVSVMLNLAMPASQGLFSQAIAQSGCSLPSVDPDEAFRVTKQTARKLGVAPTPDGFRDFTIEKTQSADRAAMIRYALGLLRADPIALLISPFRAVHGTPTLPLSPLACAGTFPSVPLLAGTIRNESGGLIDGIVQAAPAAAPFIRRGIRRALRLNRQTVDGYRNGPRHITRNSQLVEAAWCDWGFRIPTIRLVEKRPEPSWLYEFRWQNPARAPLSSAYHGLDHPFARDDLASMLALGPPAIDLFGENPPESLAGSFHGAFVQFAKTGDPGWPEYDLEKRMTMIFDEANHVEPDAAGVEREGWVGRR